MDYHIPHDKTLDSVTIPIGMVINPGQYHSCKELIVKNVVLYNCPTGLLDAEQKASVSVDERHEKGCVRRYGAIPDPWIEHKDCPCHKGSK